MAAEITERDSRQVAEEAREADWRLPSFGKDLFLGRLRLDLIHPQPRLDAANDDVDADALAQGVLGGRFTWLEEGIVDPAR